MTTNAGNLFTAEWIDRSCDQFEVDWRSGKQPRIEDRLAAANEEQRPQLLRDLLLVELELLAESGQRSSLEDYRRRFPELADAVDAAFSQAEQDSTLSQAASAGATLSQRTSTVDTSRIGDVSRTKDSTALPATLGRFRIVEVLGEGGFGTVCRAHDPQLDREVAIKVPRAGALSAGMERERFLREARAAAGLSHPNICRVHEVGEAEGRDYIVMELLAGKPLSEYLSQGKMSPRQAATIVRTLALALEEAHVKGIVHRDLKPANVMINNRGEPIIMDFGLARLEQAGDAQLTQSGMIMGSPAYMSPEQARGLSENIGPAADVYSLGVILYEMLCGRRPFEGAIGEIIGEVLHVEPKALSTLCTDVDPRLEATCQKAMAKDPSARFKSMREFAAALDEYLVEEGTIAIASSVPLPVKPANVAPTARDYDFTRWVVTCSLLAVFAGTVAAGIYFFVRTPTAQVLVHVDADLNDSTLKFLLDKNPVEAAKLKLPIELQVGHHELLVQRGQEVLKKYTVVVSRDAGPHIEFREEPLQTASRSGGESSSTNRLPEDLDRRVAEWVLEQGGVVSLLRGSERIEARQPKSLPAGQFHLDHVSLSGEKASTEVIERMHRLEYLTSLEIIGDDLNSEAIRKVSGLKHLRMLTIGSTQLGDAEFAELSGLSGLTSLNIGASHVSGAGMKYVVKLQKLREFSMGSMQLMAAHLEPLRELPRLQMLQLSAALCSDADLKPVGSLKALRILLLDRTKIGDAGLVHLTGLTELEVLDVSGTSVTTEAVQKLSGALPRCKVLSDFGTFGPGK